METYYKIKNRIKTLKAEIKRQLGFKNPNKELIDVLETFLEEYKAMLINMEIEEENARVSILPKKGK